VRSRSIRQEIRFGQSVTICKLVWLLKMVYYCPMRTNLNLDEDAHLFATVYAGAKGITLGAAVSDLIRKAEKIPHPPVELSVSPVTGLPIFTRVPGGKVVTTEMVRKLENEID